MENINRDLIDFVNASVTPYHTVHQIKMRLIEDGYKELKEKERWALERGEGYFVIRNDSSVIAFRVPEDDFEGFQIVASHSDSPNFKLKPLFELSDSPYLRLSVEKYGGPVLSSWLDRVLGVAGRVIVKEGKDLVSKLVNLERDIALIPSVAPHLMQETKLNLATDMVALMGEKDSTSRLLSLIAESVGVDRENILSHDLYLINRDKGKVWGVNSEFVSSPRLDDLQCVYSSLAGFLLSGEEVNMPVLAVFDSEEVGSSSLQGANSDFLTTTLERIAEALDVSGCEYKRIISSSFLVSADNAHAVHPNHPEVTDSLNKAYLNSGIVIKHNSQMRYITDARSEAIIKELCRISDVPYTDYANRSDIQGGSTLGHIAISKVSILGADIGLPQLSMHSAFETVGKRDTEYAVRFFEAYFSAYIKIKDNAFSVE